MVYVDEKPILLVCDNTVFVKILPATDGFCAWCGRGFPYGGAKEHYVLDVDDADLLKKAVAALEPVTPLPRAKKG
jgi:hypothetical protein